MKQRRTLPVAGACRAGYFVWISNTWSWQGHLFSLSSYSMRPLSDPRVSVFSMPIFIACAISTISRHIAGALSMQLETRLPLTFVLFFRIRRGWAQI
ncbi:uncharacterized protein EV420DRAFT_1500409 [Desarmillaria tabescens]|uniref:Uncharacterized protein n=1 Tax=Armillaria tabescens TaxID=1929756 RepID=A0AA39NRC4_ARMTA|nr:uncharacterized protein EV420DRAFT_1500409 [Desarmillaria tabescens]KAK0470401.1 hypothetical protein EV420DRAFT_1500409 [Desarmillaria tabescens]